jgi:hypothetical protein
MMSLDESRVKYNEQKDTRLRSDRQTSSRNHISCSFRIFIGVRFFQIPLSQGVGFQYVKRERIRPNSSQQMQCLSSEQQEAIESPPTFVLVQAGPGSGKTHGLCRISFICAFGFGKVSVLIPDLQFLRNV